MSPLGPLMANQEAMRVVVALLQSKDALREARQARKKPLKGKYAAAENLLDEALGQAATAIDDLYNDCTGVCGREFATFDDITKEKMRTFELQANEVKGAIKYSMDPKKGLKDSQTLESQVDKIGLDTSKALNEWSRKALSNAREGTARAAPRSRLSAQTAVSNTTGDCSSEWPDDYGLPAPSRAIQTPSIPATRTPASTDDLPLNTPPPEYAPFGSELEPESEQHAPPPLLSVPAVARILRPAVGGSRESLNLDLTRPISIPRDRSASNSHPTATSSSYIPRRPCRSEAVDHPLAECRTASTLLSHPDSSSTNDDVAAPQAPSAVRPTSSVVTNDPTGRSSLSGLRPVGRPNSNQYHTAGRDVSNLLPTPSHQDIYARPGEVSLSDNDSPNDLETAVNWPPYPYSTTPRHDVAAAQALATPTATSPFPSDSPRPRSPISRLKLFKRSTTNTTAGLPRPHDRQRPRTFAGAPPNSVDHIASFGTECRPTAPRTASVYSTSTVDTLASDISSSTTHNRHASTSSTLSPSCTRTVSQISQLSDDRISYNPRPGASIKGIPNKSNAYWGFCKGAWEIQSSPTSLVVRTVPFGTMSIRRYIACPSSNCTFQGLQTCTSSKHPVPDPRIFAHPPTGIRFTWLYLAKSHLKCSAIDTGKGIVAFKQNFGCLFCVAEGRWTPTLAGVDELLGHVLRFHSDDIGGEVRRRNCVVIGEVGGLVGWDLHIGITWMEMKRAEEEEEEKEGERRVDIADGMPRTPDSDGMGVT